MSAYRNIYRGHTVLRLLILQFKQYKVSSKRYISTTMENVDLRPPAEVRGMTTLDRSAFRKQIQVPIIKVNESLLNKVRPHIKSLLLKMDHLKPVRDAVPRTGEEIGCTAADKEILFNPLVVKGWETLPQELSSLGIDQSNYFLGNVELTYENWRPYEIFNSVLPDGQEGFSSYSRIGHVVHINLRDHLEPYKKLIGEVLLEKTVGCKTVVNKTKNIDNTYRNFELELICGEADYQVEVREHGVVFQFDFASVYWNPRLSTEHERIVKLLKPADVLYDVFAGVGPFSIPAAKKKCTVLANDLNPESFKWLNENAKKNKCQSHIKTYNQDGRDFIRNVIRSDLLERWRTAQNDENYKMHIAMNLPAMAVEFLDGFSNLMAGEDKSEFTNMIMPTVHVYTFVKGIADKESMAVETAESYLGSKLSDNLEGVYFVRNVAPNKDMFRVSFKLTEQILFSGTTRKRQSSPTEKDDNAKKICSITT